MVSPVTHRRRGGAPHPHDRAQRPSARRAHTDRHTHTALDGDALSREIFLYVELDFVCPKKDAQGTVASRPRICDRPGLHCGRARGSIADRSVRRSHRPGAHTHHARPLLDARHQCTEARQADAVRAPHRARLYRPSAPHGSLGKHMPCCQRARRNAQRCPEDLEATMDALAYRRPLAVATFRWSLVSSFGYLCREERGAPWPPGRR